MDDEQVARGTDVVRLDFPDCDIWIRASSPAEKNWRARSCAKEPWTVEWLRGAVRPGEVLYDVGANVGTYALVAAKHAQPRRRIRTRICQLRAAVRQHPAERLPARHRAGAAAGTRYEQPSLAMTLDAMIAAFDLPRPHHLKIDVDGAEDRVLAGAPETLRSETLRTVLIEVDGVQWSGVSSLLERAGLILHTRIERRKPDAPEYGLFVRRPAPHSPSRWWTFLHNTSRP